MTDTSGPPRPTEEWLFGVLGARFPGQVAYNGDEGAATRRLAAAGLALPNCHWALDLPPSVTAALDGLFTEFGGTRRDWPAADLLPQLSGVLYEGPGAPRLIQWDAPETFSPYRLQGLRRLSDVLEWGFDAGRHEAYCLGPETFREFWAALKLPPSLLGANRSVTSPAHLAAIFARARSRLPMTAHVRRVRGFPFAGGRVAQRAYYDALIDCAHLTSAWRGAGFGAPLRVSPWDISLPGTPSAGPAAWQREVVTNLLSGQVMADSLVNSGGVAGPSRAVTAAAGEADEDPKGAGKRG